MFLGLFLVGLLVASGCEQQLAPKRDGLSQYAIRSGEIYAYSIDAPSSNNSGLELINCIELCTVFDKECMGGDVVIEISGDENLLTLPLPCHTYLWNNGNLGEIIHWINWTNVARISRRNQVGAIHLMCECI